MNATYSPEKQNNKAPLPDSHRSVPSIVSTYVYDESCIAFVNHYTEQKAKLPKGESALRRLAPNRGGERVDHLDLDGEDDGVQRAARADRHRGHAPFW